jgi:hypothetical protein|uniref:Uncharacterized protein n=2 Tax=Picea TaxID=3328 RepID=A0A101M4E8_PICGL|nr:hypothetical protein ABT39_MTgene722 [Picea glauca]QHR90196.1 hypothetical protein Q903MT_gene4219 [Picea sitchensis]
MLREAAYPVPKKLIQQMVLLVLLGIELDLALMDLYNMAIDLEDMKLGKVKLLLVQLDHSLNRLTQQNKQH